MSESKSEKVITNWLDKESYIDKLLLSNRTYNALRRQGIVTIEQLISYTDQDLLKIRNLGMKSLEEVRTKLQRYGLNLKEVKTKPIAKKSSISKLGLRFWVCRALMNKKIETVEQLIGYTERDLLKIVDFRMNIMTEINMKLQEYGLYFKESETELIDKESDVKELLLSYTTYNALKNQGIVTIEQLIKYTEQDLLEMWRIGRKSLEEVKTKLQKYGLGLKEVETKSIDNEEDISELQLSDRVYKILKEAGINSIEKLIGYTDLELLKIRNLGIKCLEEIHIKLRQYSPQIKVLIVSPKKEEVVATMGIGKEIELEVIYNKLQECGFEMKNREF